MKRFPGWVFGMALALDTFSALASVQLDIAPRKQWDNRYGYCGECCIQQSALYYGAYISQYRAREIIDPTQWQDVWVPENSGPVFDALRLNYEAWDSSRPKPQYMAYFAWIKGHLQQGHPVIFDVFVQGESDPDYDHIMLAIGFTSPDSTVYHATDRLIFNDNYMRAPYDQAFGSLYDTRAMEGNGRYYEYCIPKRVDRGCAVTGIKDSSGAARPVSLKLNRWDEPNITKGAAPAQLTATIQMRSLVAGKSYALLRYDDYRQVPTSGYLSSAFSKKTVFTASGSTKTLTDYFMSDKIVIYRCVPNSKEASLAGEQAFSGVLLDWVMSGFDIRFLAQPDRLFGAE